jgi:hypothetical protein
MVTDYDVRQLLVPQPVSMENKCDYASKEEAHELELLDVPPERGVLFVCLPLVPFAPALRWTLGHLV